MRRRLFTIAAIPSAIFLFCTIAMWIDGRNASRGIWVSAPANYLWAAAYSTGHVGVANVGDLNPPAVPRGERIRLMSLPPADLRSGLEWQHWGIGYSRGPGSGFMTFVIVLPLWIPCVLSLILPITWCLTRGPRWGPGLCQKCGYDLRASSDRCPECGTAFARAA